MAEETHVFGEWISSMHQQELHGVEVVEVAGLMERGPA